MCARLRSHVTIKGTCMAVPLTPCTLWMQYGYPAHQQPRPPLSLSLSISSPSLCTRIVRVVRSVSSCRVLQQPKYVLLLTKKKERRTLALQFLTRSISSLFSLSPKNKTGYLSHYQWNKPLHLNVAIQSSMEQTLALGRCNTTINGIYVLCSLLLLFF